jgi:hypothetical protein
MQEILRVWHFFASQAMPQSVMAPGAPSVLGVLKANQTRDGEMGFKLPNWVVAAAANGVHGVVAESEKVGEAGEATPAPPSAPTRSTHGRTWGASNVRSRFRAEARTSGPTAEAAGWALSHTLPTAFPCLESHGYLFADLFGDATAANGTTDSCIPDNGHMHAHGSGGHSVDLDGIPTDLADEIVVVRVGDSTLFNWRFPVGFGSRV